MGCLTGEMLAHWSSVSTMVPLMGEPKVTQRVHHWDYSSGSLTGRQLEERKEYLSVRLTETPLENETEMLSDRQMAQ